LQPPVTDGHDLPVPAATDRAGHRLAPLLRPGLPVLLQGPVGAGKSHLARAIIRRLAGAATEVPSPTFTLVQTYDTPAGEVWHADLYRLGDPAEADELGLTDAMDTAITLIEWPDRLGRRRPPAALTLTLSQAGEGRRLVVGGPPDIVAAVNRTLAA
jgi:tRNA threonylcarbamoyladenosine biosynthesis protein TsaE